METIVAEERQQMVAVPATDGFFFMSPWKSLATSGHFASFELPAADGAESRGEFQRGLAQAFMSARAAGIARPVVVGAIPFDTRKPSSLFIPQQVRFFSRVDYQKGVSAAFRAPAVTGRQEIPEQPVFEEMVARGALATSQPGIDKVVLSRLIDITTENAIDREALMQRLIGLNPASYNFHVPMADGGALMGASPELLLRMNGNAFSSLPLAGSAKRAADPVQDKAVGQALMNSRKDRHEHQLVTDAMRDVLAPRVSCLALPDQPELMTTPQLWHLSTPIEGQVRPGHENALSLACLLHPTPALSGFPNDAALRLIGELEPFNRELFGGIVGWCDDAGNGEWVVTIRCARLYERRVRLFAGAGIVPASSPTAEWNETGTKLSTMLNVFGLN
ncbi:isochorismate synthase [Erwinia sp. CPCC 100877]|nr:isochorismate synthase [Erwinia sp. CPCC 100877]